MNSQTLQIIEKATAEKLAGFKALCLEAQQIIHAIEEAGWSVTLERRAYMIEGFAYRINKEGTREQTNLMTADVDEHEQPVIRVLGTILKDIPVDLVP